MLPGTLAVNATGGLFDLAVHVFCDGAGDHISVETCIYGPFFVEKTVWCSGSKFILKTVDGLIGVNRIAVY